VPRRDLPAFRDLRDFLAHLEPRGALVRIRHPVSAVHEIAEIHRRVVQRHGPALLFEQVTKADGAPSAMPVLVNLFGTVERVAWGLGVRPERLGELGELLAELRQPSPPQGLGDALRRLPLARAALAMRPRAAAEPAAQQVVQQGEAIDLGELPAQICWPGEPAPLLTWPVVITRPPESDAAEHCNLGVYRVQVLARDRAILRWLAQRGGARHHRMWQARGQRMPVAIAIGADPATVLAAALPLPETVSEIGVAGLLRGERPALARCVSIPLQVPAEAEIVIEGWVAPDETAPEGPYGDHTGYYNAVEPFPVLRVSAITRRRQPIYLSTFTGRPPDEPSRIGEALNALFLPFVRRQFPEIADLWLPPEACSYRVCIVAIRKRYPGQARRVMLGLWSMLPQLTYTKLIIVVDADIAVREWADVIWAVATRSDPSRDLVRIDATPIDALDFASPRPGLGSKLGIDATVKIGPETDRPFAAVLAPDPAVAARIDALWEELGLGPRRSVA
jgi:4-hydroxy-3-polyprenylbenzoate decarboxylase